MSLRLLIFGDIMGKLGRRGLVAALPHLKKKYQPAVTIANVENLAHGKGITEHTIEEIHEGGVELFTSGNHIWAKPEGATLLSDDKLYVLRPANYPVDLPGAGAKVVPVGDHKLLLVNLLGRVFMKETLDCPFRTMDAILEMHKDEDLAGIVVDFHAEATSEKTAFGHYLDGRVSAVYGTHTHVPTNDGEILPGGTAYLTDVGMVGGKGTVIGVEKENPIKGFLTQQPQAWEYPETGTAMVNGWVVTIDPATKKATAIEQFREAVDVPA